MQLVLWQRSDCQVNCEKQVLVCIEDKKSAEKVIGLNQAREMVNRSKLMAFTENFSSYKYKMLIIRKSTA